MKEIDGQRSRLRSGEPVTIRLSPQGYNATIRISIDPINAQGFWADWEQDDPTRFPARIRAAAWALRRQGCHGSYIITHETGLMTIRDLA